MENDMKPGVKEEGRILKVMWDYSAFPVWETFHRAGPIQQVSVASLPISKPLKAALEDWSQEWTNIMIGSDTSSWTPPGERTQIAWTDMGRLLAKRLAQELGHEFEVLYFNELSGELEAQ